MDVDLRWGVIGEQDVSEACREVITECRPRFLCMLGGRYGTIPEGSESSITDEEVRFGVFDHSEREVYALFYFRHGTTTEQMSLRRVGQIRETKHGEKAGKLARLKRRIRRTNHPFFLYRPRWSVEEQQLVDLETLGDRVGRDILLTIDDEFGAQSPDVSSSESDEEDALMASFVEMRSGHFVPGSRETIIRNLLEHARAVDGPNYVCIVGASGSGKSALLAHLSEQMAQRSQSPCIFHSVGATPGSTDATRTLRRLCRQLKARCADISESIPDSPEELREAFPDFLQEVCKREAVLILLDAVDRFDPTSRLPGLKWLPERPPANARFIVSSVDPVTPQQLRSGGCSVREIELAPLSRVDGEAIIERFHRRFHKELAAEQSSALLSKADAGLPLYLLASLEELRTLGSHKDISKRIRELPPTTHELFAWILRRLEDEGGFRSASSSRIGHELVPRFCAMLCASREGLSHQELTDLLEMGDSRGNVAALIRFLRPYLMSRGRLLDFHHAQVRTAAERAYLESATELFDAHSSLATYFDHHCKTGRPWRTASKRSLAELPYHLWNARAKSQLFALARNDEFLMAQTKGVPEDFDLPFRTMRWALDVARVDRDPVAMSEWSLTHAHRLSRGIAVNPIDVLSAGDLEPGVALHRSWVWADSLEPRQRVYAMLVLAWKLESRGRRTEAAQTIDRLDDRAAVDGGAYQPLIAMLLSWLDPVCDVAKLAKVLLTSDEWIEKLAEALARRECYGSAERVVELLDTPSSRDRAFQSVAMVQARAERYDEAIESMSLVEDHTTRTYGLNAGLLTYA